LEQSFSVVSLQYGAVLTFTAWQN